MNNSALQELSLDAGDVTFPEAEKRGPMLRIKQNKVVQKGAPDIELEDGDVICTANFEKTEESKKYPGTYDHFFRGAKDSLFILKGNASVNKQVKLLREGELTRIVYNGTYTSAKAPGKTCHAFIVEGALSGDNESGE